MTTVVVASNGYVDGPAQALRDFLVDRDQTVVTVLHPLATSDGTTHTVTRFEHGRTVAERRLRVPLRPPASYAIDPFVPLRVPRADAWIGFNPLATARGLFERRLGRVDRVVQWSVDFVPDRFGGGSPLTRLYDLVDRICCRRADAWVELSVEARDARDARHGVRRDPARMHIVPMGAWLGRTPVVPSDGHARRRIVYLGHLVPRQGVDVLLRALAVLLGRDERVTADIVGTGPEEERLRDLARLLGLADAVRFHGYVPDHRAVESILAGASVGVAPYRRDPASFTRFADPGKLKAYLAAGLPVVLTDVPPNAAELVAQAGAELVADEPEALAQGLARVLADPAAWRTRRDAARAFACRFDWEVLLGEVALRLRLAS